MRILFPLPKSMIYAGHFPKYLQHHISLGVSLMSGYVDEWIHACYVPRLPDGTDAVVAKVHRHKEDGTVVPALVVYDKPHRSFYVTKKQFQTHPLKKEWERVDRLDRYETPNYLLAENLAKALDPTSLNRRYTSVAQLSNSPYVYGADIHIETLIKHKMMTQFEASGLRPTPITTGFFDIEKDVTGSLDGKTNIITVTHENQVFTAIHEQFLTVRQPDGTFRPGNLEEFIDFSKSTLNHHISVLLEDYAKKNPKSHVPRQVEQTPFEYHYYVGKTSLDLIAWIFRQIHQMKTDFIGIWNLSFDIPEILNEIKTSRVRFEDILCPPELAQKYHYVRYTPDEKETDNIFKKWHWLHAASYSQFVDSQNLYSILRTVKGKEVTMKLNDILQVNDLGGKLTFKDDDPETENLSDLDWHRYMQRNEAYKYIVYNQFDCISLQLMEWKNNDLSSMVVLGGTGRLAKWTRQTRKVADALYFDALEAGLVTASPGQTMVTAFDELIDKVGGAVLSPERTFDLGWRVFTDMPHIVTMLHPFTNDVDFSGMYPTVTIAANISKETKISTGIEINGLNRDATQMYYSLIISPRENAVQIGQDYFGLPGYRDMEDRFAAYLKTWETPSWS